MSKQHVTWIAAGLGALLGARAASRASRRISFKGRSALVTGGSRGLGLAISRRLVKLGVDRIVLVARDGDELARAARDLTRRQPGVTVHELVADLTEDRAPGHVVERAIALCGELDVIVNNAGFIAVAPLEHVTEEDMETAMRLNYRAPLRIVLAALPSMRQRGSGRIVNISSIGGKLAVPHLLAYSASKFALTGVSDGLRAELDASGIRITTVCPGLMRTGSHVNVPFKGKHEQEFAWFAISDAAPGLSVNVERAARKIVNACRHGDRQLIVGVAARMAILAQAIVPELVADAMALTARLLPGPAAGGERAKSGWESRSGIAPSIATRLADRAVPRHNELAGHDTAELRSKS